MTKKCIFKFRLVSSYETETLFLNMSDAYRIPTLIGHVSMKSPIQKIFLTILTRIKHSFKKHKYINFLKTQIYCINFYYDYKNK